MRMLYYSYSLDKGTANTIMKYYFTANRIKDEELSLDIESNILKNYVKFYSVHGPKHCVFISKVQIFRF